MKNLIYLLKRYYHFFKTGLLKGLPAQIVYQFPEKKLKIILITGTDGKTTTSTLTYHLLKTAGLKTGLISTVAAYLGQEKIDTGLHVTAPDPLKLRQFMQKMVKQNVEWLVLEFTSHGAYQFRSWGLSPKLAGVTNITHEHLDYHLNYQNYLQAKALLLKKAQTVFLNQDDQSFYKLKEQLDLKKQTVKSYSLTDKIDRHLNQAIKKRFKESYNQANARLAVALVQQLGLSNQQIVAGLNSFPGVAGRMEKIETNQDFTVIVDFAHTPNALENALKSLAKQYSGRIIAVFGCAGLRDAAKRPLMGKIAVENADLAVFTAEDPRSENVWSIIRQMKENLKKGHNRIISIADRQKAIEFALTQLAKKGDVVAIFGKGPEKSMCFGQTEYPWSDKAVVQEVLAKL